MNTLVGPLPRHLYVYVDSAFTHRDPCGWIPAVWFGLVSFPGRTWGCTAMLESGSIYRNLPPTAISFTPDPDPEWSLQQAQSWDCYGVGFSALEYPYLAGLRCAAKCAGEDFQGSYLFTVAPVGDAFSAYPEQAKEFSFVELENGRLTIQPTNNLLFEERSFTKPAGWPVLKRQIDTYHCE